MLERVRAVRLQIGERSAEGGLEVTRSTDSRIDSKIESRHVVQHRDELNA